MRMTFPGFRLEGTVRGHLRGPEGADHQAEGALKKTRCADCGALHRGWYDRTVRRVARPVVRATRDEIAIRKGHTYRIVVSDLERERPIWFGGERSLRGQHGPVLRLARAEEEPGIRLAVMDMWKPFRNVDRSRERRRPRSCSTSSTSCATWARRSMQVARASTPACRARTGASSRDRSTRCFAPRNLSLGGRQALARCSRPTSASTSPTFEGAFGQLWDYQREAWARRFFDNWRAASSGSASKSSRRCCRSCERPRPLHGAHCCAVLATAKRTSPCGVALRASP